VNGHIGKMIREYNTAGMQPAVTPAVASAATTTAPATHYNYSHGSRLEMPEIDTYHHTYQIGDVMLVKSPLKAYIEFTSLPGIIKRVVQGHTYFCVLLDCPLQRQAVQRINSLHVNKVRFPFLKQDESELLCLKVGQIEARKNQHTAATIDVTLLGKRKADSNGTG
jgi:hypothetical protein